MSLCRRTDDCDLYIYSSGEDVYTCCGCSIESGPSPTYGIKALISHLDAHVQAGDKVPDRLFDLLREELEEDA